MRVLLFLLTLLLTLPAAAGLFDAPRPTATLGLDGQRGGQQFLPVDQAFRPLSFGPSLPPRGPT